MIQPIKKILITGSGTGIGAACAKMLNKSGFYVLLHCNTNIESAKRIASELDSNHKIYVADLSKTEHIDTLIEALKEEGPIYGLINNAGISIDAPLFSSKTEDFESMISVNLRSNWYLTKKISRLMMKQRSGKIINISSVIGTTGNPGQAIYGMTKAALDNFTKTIAKELAGYGIIVHCIAPGFIRTQMTEKLPQEIQNKIIEKIPLQRMGTAEEIAKWVTFLIKEDTYSTGNIIHVNGGLYCG